MRKTSFKLKEIYALAREFAAVQRRVSAVYRHPGRPRIYDEALIIAIASIQNLYSFSFREALEFCEDRFERLPALSVYHYRLERLPKDTVQRFIAFLGEKIAQAANQSILYCIMDATGFSFKDTYPLKFYRGTEIRKIKSHIKAAILAGVFGKKRFIIGARAGPPYSSEIKLIEPLLEKIPSPSYALGDKAYDCIRLLETIVNRDCLPAIAIKESQSYSIRHPLRKLSKSISLIKEIYSKRTLVEGLFGNTKQALSSHIRVFNQNIATVFALLRLALFNIAILIGLRKSRVLICILEHPLAVVDKM